MGEDKTIITNQKSGMMFRRLLYLLFLLYIIVNIEESNVVKNNIVYIMFGISVLLWIADELLYRFDYFNNAYVIRTFRFLQYMLLMLNKDNICVSEFSFIIYVGLLMLFVNEILITFDFADSYRITVALIITAIPIVILIFYESIHGVKMEWIYLLIPVITFCVCFYKIIYSQVYMAIGRLRDSHKQVMLMNQVKSTNQRLVKYQDKIKATNEELNLQKIETERTYNAIKQANSEMSTQVEMLRYIASSFDIPKIIDTLTESIMSVKKPGLCGIYIDKNVYMNKYASQVVKTSFTSLSYKLKDDLPKLYAQIKKEKKASYYVDKDIEKYSFLNDINIKTILIMPLYNGKKLYGVLIVGSSNEKDFDSNIYYYENTIAQLNIAIKNTKIYNDIENMARKDGLTNINNRTYFNQLFSDTIRETIKHEETMSVALFDIDFFKKVNDTYGHLMGDEVIKTIAKTTEKLIDKYDGFICRYGGEEFVVALPGKDVDKALPIMEELHKAIKALEIEFDDMKIHVDISIGLSSYPEICDNPHDLVKRADWSMYYSKEHGRGKITVDNPSIEKH